jgi:hypothetical protein
MAVWREPVLFSDAHVFPAMERHTAVIIRHHFLEGPGFELFFRRWEGAEELRPFGPAVAMRRELCAEYWPRTPLCYPTLDQAREAARELAKTSPVLTELEFDRRQCRGAMRPVAEVAGTADLKAWIYLHPDGRYDVRCFHHEPIAVRPDGSVAEWEWMRVRFDELLFASDLEAAEEAARRELNLLAQTSP